MPVGANSVTAVSKKAVTKKAERSAAVTTKGASAVTADNKTKPTEKLDLNISSKKSLSGGTKTPNIDILETPRSKDNRRFSSRFKVSRFREIEELPLLKDVNASEREALLLEKLRQCGVVFDWNDVISDIRYKEIKRKALLEVCDFMSGLNGSLSDEVCRDLICMIGSNIFRTLPPSCNALGPEPEGDDDEPYYEPSWPHLQHVYEIFLRFLESPDFSPTMAKHHIDQNFVLYIMDLFDCEDPRERDLLKTILHRIYGKMVNLRAFIRKQINFIFYKLLYETESFKGTGELLEILGSIINGFQVPLKDEHKVFLRRVLLPMHKVSSFSSYASQLTYCVVEFIRKDLSLLRVVVVHGLIRFWPKTISLKEIMFLNELEECLELSSPEEFRIIAKVVFTQLAKCICSQQFQVCERALLFWNNDTLHPLFVRNIDIILPTTFPALYLAKQHWNKTIHGLVYSALKVMMDINQKLFDECTVKLKEEKLKEFENNKRHQEWWNNVDNVAKKNPLYSSFASGDEVQNNTLSSESNRTMDMQGALKELAAENLTSENISLDNNKKSRRTEAPWKPGINKTSKSFKN